MINFPDYEYLHDVDIVSSDFIQRITSVINKIALFKEMRIKNYSHNWFDDENLDKIILRDKHLKKFKASRRNIDEQFVLGFFCFFSIGVFFHDHSRITGLQGKGEGISLTLYYHFHPLHRHLDISREITAESSPLHVGSSRTRTRNLWFLSESR